jgi:3-hydroxyisobutyrate dehydrogenase-like beta-hydroxyacid dehydrogenase
MIQVAMIGLGLVGSAISERLIAAGHRVSGFDPVESCRLNLVQHGGHAAVSAQEAVHEAEVVLLSLPNSDISSSVLEDLLPHLCNKTVIDTTTGDPAAMMRMAESLAAKSIPYLDATIVGSSRQIREGEVQVLVGGEESNFSACRLLFDTFARHVFHLGPAGSGARMKLVVNLVLGLNRVALAEGLSFAQAYGVDPAVALDVLKAGLAYSRIMDTKGQKMLQRDFRVEARLSQHHKDVRLILDAANREGLKLPLAEVHDKLLEQAEALGYADSDNSAIIMAFGQQQKQSNPKE